MAEKDTPTTHTEPMTTEMMAAVDANSSSDEKPAKKSVPKKKSAVKKKATAKKKAAPKKKSVAKKKAAVKKSSVAKKKAAPKRKVATKKKSTVKKKAAPKKSNATKTTTIAAVAVATAATKQTADLVNNKSEPQPTEKKSEKVEAPVAPTSSTETAVEATPKAAETTSESSEDKQHQQQIRQKLVDLGVADADEIGAIAHEEPNESSRPFWIKAMIALLVIVGLYFYSKGSNDTSSTQITSQPVMAPLENHSGENEAVISEPEDSEEPLSEHLPPDTLETQSISVPEEQNTNVGAAQGSDAQPENLSTPAVEDSGSDGDGSVASAPASDAVVTTEQIQGQYDPGYIYPNPWNPNYYPPFNVMNQVAPVNPYYYPPINMAPGMVPPPYYSYPLAPYQSPQLAPTE